jgi:hypothetical protein
MYNAPTVLHPSPPGLHSSHHTSSISSPPPPLSPQLVAIPLMILGVVLVGYITSFISSIVAVRNASQARVMAKKQLVLDFMKDRWGKGVRAAH